MGVLKAIKKASSAKPKASVFKKNVYTSPVLKRYGSVSTLTLGSGGSQCDVNAPVNNNSVNDCDQN